MRLKNRCLRMENPWNPKHIEQTLVNIEYFMLPFLVKYWMVTNVLYRLMKLFNIYQPHRMNSTHTYRLIDERIRHRINNYIATKAESLIRFRLFLFSFFFFHLKTLFNLRGAIRLSIQKDKKRKSEGANDREDITEPYD